MNPKEDNKEEIDQKAKEVMSIIVIIIGIKKESKER